MTDLRPHIAVHQAAGPVGPMHGPALAATAISVRQPWAEAVLKYGATVLTMPLTTTVRGRCVLHVLPDPDPVGAAHIRAVSGRRFPPQLPARVFVGHVDLVDAHPADGCAAAACTRWAVPGGAHHWVVAHPQPLYSPVPGRNQADDHQHLGLWRVPDHAIADINAAELP